jgi:hypothetical protein
MSRSGVYYAVKVMERVAAGTAADVPAGPAKRAAARPARTTARRGGSFVSLARWVLAVMHFEMRGSQGGAGQGSRRLGRAARAD